MEQKGSVGEKLRIIREERGLSQRELSQRAGISANTVSLIERDENSPSVSTLQRLASVLNVRMSYFFDDHEPSQILHIKADERPAIRSKGVKIEGLGSSVSLGPRRGKPVSRAAFERGPGLPVLPHDLNGYRGGRGVDRKAQLKEIEQFPGPHFTYKP